MIDRILDFIYPRKCEICKRPVDRPGRYLCTDCLNRLPILPSQGVCRICGRDAVGNKGEFLCEDCRKHKPGFDRAVTAVSFDGEARELVNAFKFRNSLYLLKDLVDLLEGATRARLKVNEIDLVLPMPSTGWHRFLRGYNQCEYLARALAKRLGKRYNRWLLKRVGSPRRQGELNESERLENVIGTFALRRPINVDTVLVVDDIMTTGATLSECAKTLKKAGVHRVFTASVARSVRY